MARPTRSKRKEERARGVAPRKPARPATGRSVGRVSAQGAVSHPASVGTVPTVAKVGLSAILILLVVYLISLGR